MINHLHTKLGMFYIYMLQIWLAIQLLGHPYIALLISVSVNINLVYFMVGGGTACTACTACWTRFMCHHKLWPTSLSHPFSSLNTSLGIAGEKYYQEITIPIFRLALQNFAIPGSWYSFLLLSLLLTFFWLVCYCSLWLYFSPGN